MSLVIECQVRFICDGCKKAFLVAVYGEGPVPFPQGWGVLCPECLHTIRAGGVLFGRNQADA